jgi:lysophospholipase L1-like esterase
VLAVSTKDGASQAGVLATADGATGPPAPTANTIVLFGDSITALNCAQPDKYGPLFVAAGWFNWANSILGQAFQVTNCAGVGGNTTTQMLARIQTDVLAYKPGWVTVMGGANDVATSFPATTTIANLKAIYTLLNAAGIKIVASTVTASVNYTPGAQQAAWAEVNAWIKEYAKTQNNFILWDAASVTIDPNSTNVVPLPGMTRDGVHPSTLGGYLLGKSLAAVLVPFASAPAALPAENYDPFNLLPNGLSTGSAGTLKYGSTGTVATGWTLGNNGISCVGSQTTRTDGLGGVQIMTGVGANNASIPCSYQQDVTSGWAAGDRVWAQAEIMAGSTNGVFIELLTIPGTPSQEYRYLYPAQGDGLLNQTLPNLVLRTQTVTIPAGTTDVYVRVMGFGASGTTQVGRVELRKAVEP